MEKEALRLKIACLRRCGCSTCRANEREILTAFDELKGRVNASETAYRVEQERADEKSDQREFEVERNVKLETENKILEKQVKYLKDKIIYTRCDGCQWPDRAEKVEATLQSMGREFKVLQESKDAAWIEVAKEKLARKKLGPIWGKH